METLIHPEVIVLFDRSQINPGLSSPSLVVYCQRSPYHMTQMGWLPHSGPRLAEVVPDNCISYVNPALWFQSRPGSETIMMISCDCVVKVRITVNIVSNDQWKSHPLITRRVCGVERVPGQFVAAANWDCVIYYVLHSTSAPNVAWLFGNFPFRMFSSNK